MNRYIFNAKYFDEVFLKGCSCEKKYEEIALKANMSIESCKSKLRRKRNSRPIKEADYLAIKKIDPCLLLDTERLIGKLILRANMDLTTNERFVLYMMVCCLASGDDYVSLEQLTGRIADGRYKSNKIERILQTCQIITDTAGTKAQLFFSDESGYSIDLTALVKYTDL